MRYLRLYPNDASFKADEINAGGTGNDVEAMVPCIVKTADLKKMYFNPHDKEILLKTITISYKDSAGNKLAEDDVKTVKYFSGVTQEIVLTPKSIEGYVNAENKKTISVTEDSDVVFRYYGPNHFKPLTFNIESGGIIKWCTNNTNFRKTIEYRINDGNWRSITSYTGSSVPGIYVSAGDKVEFRGNNGTYCGEINHTRVYNTFSGSSCTFSIGGNIMSLINSEGFSGETMFTTDYTFSMLFNSCTGLTSAENLVLPVTTLTNSCYNSMFDGCTSLTTAPGLLATTLAQACYHYMFNGCTSLLNTPELPAATLDDGCYQGMFANCTNLEEAPNLKSVSMCENCYKAMFNNCTSLVNAPALPATILAESCYEYMFAGCTSLIYAHELPATNLAYECYYGMFQGCTSLVNAPALSATNLHGYCCMYMFANCTSLLNPPVLPATGAAICCYNSMFKGCTSLVNAPELPALNIGSSSYDNMFEDCSNLSYIKCLATSFSIGTPTYAWVKNVSPTGTFVKNQDMTLWTTGDNGIPSGWTVQDATS